METVLIDIGVFHHIGVVTNSISQATKVYQRLGLQPMFEPDVCDLGRRIKLNLLFKENHPTVELIEPIDAQSPVTRILKQFGSNCYHTCYHVAKLDQSIKNLRKAQFVLISEPSPAILFEQKRVAFLFNKSIGLIEILEE